MLKPLVHKIRDAMSEGGTKTIKDFVSGSVFAVTRTNKMQNASSGKDSFGDHISMTELWYEREVEGKDER